MRYLAWALRLIVFVVVLLFALKNTEPVTIGFIGGVSITDVPLIMALVVAFFAGAICIYVFSLSGRFAQSRQISQLKYDLQQLQNSVEAGKKTTEEKSNTTAIAAPDGFVPNP